MVTADHVFGTLLGSGSYLALEARARGKRAAEGREGEDDARARVRRRASGGDGDDDAVIL